MSVWANISEAISDLGHTKLLGSLLGRAPEESVAFTIAIIGLSAKMAKADGRVTRDEVITLRRIFEFDAGDERELARVFDLARQDTAGYEQYARRIKRLFSRHPEMLEDIFEGLFQIAISDGTLHDRERQFLWNIAGIFKLSERFVERLIGLYLPSEESDPFDILNIPRGASNEEISAAYKRIIRDNHPDQLRARGLPDEAIAMSEARIRAVNRAYELLKGQLR